MKLAEWARTNGVHPQTAYRWFRQGHHTVPTRRLPAGTILVGTPGNPLGERTVLYARASAHDQRPIWTGRSLGRSVDRFGDRAGCCRGRDGHRGRLRPKWRAATAQALLADPTVALIVVEHRDRLARFGVERLEAAMSAHGRRLVVVDPSETHDDLVRDMIDVLAGFCVRLYGHCGARNRAMRVVTCAKQAPDSVSDTGT